MTETQDCEAPWKVYANENVVFGKCLEIKINAKEFKIKSSITLQIMEWMFTKAKLRMR